MIAQWPKTRGSRARRLKLIAAPTAEPIGATLFKATLKLHVNTNAFTVQNRIATARRTIENKINRKLVQQVWDMFLDDEAYISSGRVFYYNNSTADGSLGYPEITLPFPPVQSVIGVYTTNSDGVETMVDTSVYFVSKAQEPCRIRLRPGNVWPTHRGGEGLRIRFACGYGIPFTVSQDSTNTVLCRYHGYSNNDYVQFTSQDGTLPDPLQTNTNYIVQGSSALGFLLTDTSGNPITFTAAGLAWTGVGFVGEIPPPLIMATVMVSALEQGGEIPTRLPGVSTRMSPIGLPVDPAELISDYCWPYL